MTDSAPVSPGALPLASAAENSAEPNEVLIGESRISGVGRLVGKESNRAEAILAMLCQMGVDAGIGTLGALIYRVCDIFCIIIGTLCLLIDRELLKKSAAAKEDAS